MESRDGESAQAGRTGIVPARDAGADGPIKVRAKFGMDVGDAADRVADPCGHRLAGTFGNIGSKRTAGSTGPRRTSQFGTYVFSFVGGPSLAGKI